MNWRRDLIGLLAVGGFVTICVLLLMGGLIDPTMEKLALIVIGQLSMKFGTVVDYHYGSSAGSTAKDQMMVDTAKAASATVAETARAASIAVTETAAAAASKVPS